MNPAVATLIFFIGVLGLFYLDREKSVQTSKALWLPVVWLWLAGSQPLSFWLGIAPAQNSNVDGTPFDRVVFSAMLVLGIIVLIRRSTRVADLLRANWPICLFFSYCLISVMWSDFPDVSLKRWIKAIADLVMVLVILTDGEPLTALKRIFSRVGFVLLPACVLVDKYYGNISRSYDPFSGAPTTVGVTTDKNSLGLIAFVLTLGAVWQITELLRCKEQPGLRRRLLAQGTLLVFGISILMTAHSATSWACFAVSAAVVIVTAHRVFKRKAWTHALALTLVVAGALLFFGAAGAVFHTLGRDSTFTGRTELWQHIIPLAPNPVFGAGFESFWLGPRLERLRGIFWFTPNESHNGYIEVYLQLGWVGIGLIALLLVNGYLRAVAALGQGAAAGRLAFAYIIAALLHNITEAGFRLLDPAWIFLLLMIVSASVAAKAAAKAERHDSTQHAPPSTGPWNAVTDRRPSRIEEYASHSSHTRIPLRNGNVGVHKTRSF